MLVKEFTYTDWCGTERTEKVYFNLTKTEIVELNFSVKGGLEGLLDEIVKSKDEVSLMKHFKEIILDAYAVKSEDGRRLMKRPELAQEFTETPMYDMLMQELLSDESKAAKFIEAILPKSDAPTMFPGA